MLGRKQTRQTKLFYSGFNLDDRVPADHPLRRVAAMIDFDFVRPHVAPLYGQVGNPSIDPAVLLKLMFLLFYENVSSERALTQQLSMRLDWLWFCGYDLDSDLPNHSVLSKARRRWGPTLFAKMFALVVEQCQRAGLIDGRTVHVDGCVIEADADRRDLQPAWVLRGLKLFEQLEQDDDGDGDGQRTDAPAGDSNAPTSRPPDPPASPPADRTRRSSTDPDARQTAKDGRSMFGYKDHRVVDDKHGIITATVTTPAAVAEHEELIEVLKQHEQHTQCAARTVVADAGYGVGQVYDALRDEGVKPCIPHKRSTEAEGKFTRDQFRYDATNDCFWCPAGQRLDRRPGAAHRDRLRYRAKAAVCAACPLRQACTASSRGRLLSRHVHQDAIDWADECFSREHRRRLLNRRRHRGEGSFADATHRHGYKRARWRGLIRMTIQNLLIAIVQNIRKLIRYVRPPRPTVAATRWSGIMLQHCHGALARQ